MAQIRRYATSADAGSRSAFAKRCVRVGWLASSPLSAGSREGATARHASARRRGISTSFRPCTEYLINRGTRGPGITVFRRPAGITARNLAGRRNEIGRASASLSRFSRGFAVPLSIRWIHRVLPLLFITAIIECSIRVFGFCLFLPQISAYVFAEKKSYR